MIRTTLLFLAFPTVYFLTSYAITFTQEDQGYAGKLVCLFTVPMVEFVAFGHLLEGQKMFCVGGSGFNSTRFRRWQLLNQAKAVSASKALLKLLVAAMQIYR